MGTTGFLQPSPVFPDEARLQKQQHFSQVQKLFFDAPIKMHYPSPFSSLRATKNPRGLIKNVQMQGIRNPEE